MNLGLENSVIMVAAASRGLGYGIARACAQEGARVAIAARSLEDTEKAAETLRAETGSEVLASRLDASDGDSILAWRDVVLAEFGAIHGLVVNAGGPPPGQFDDFDDAAWQAAFELTLMSSVRMVRAVLPAMREQGGGSIVTVTSSSVKEPIDVLLLSNVMRSGVVSLVKSLSRSLAGECIRVNNLVPGTMDTDRVAVLNSSISAKTGQSVEQVRAAAQSSIPWGRYGTADEFGSAGAFLLSDAAGYITGETLIVDGGASRTVW